MCLGFSFKIRDLLELVVFRARTELTFNQYLVHNFVQTLRREGIVHKMAFIRTYQPSDEEAMIHVVSDYCPNTCLDK